MDLACCVTARVAGGAKVTIVEETAYPFAETVTFLVRTERAAAFPLHLRIPAWCQRAKIAINGQAEENPQGGRVLKLNRTWASGDRVELTLPMTLTKADG
jgi:DUF1680 family protein